MFITKMSLPRRTFLRGMGATLALPLLDAMVPALSALAVTSANPARRLGFVYVPNGVIQDQWVPAATGAGFELSPTLAPLAAVRDKLLVLSGLTQRQAESFGDGNGDHARGCASWLNGVHPKRTEGAGVQAGTTIDQIAANELGKLTRLPSLELALESQERGLGSCDNGYACVYINTISWRTPTSPVPMEIHPRVAFDRLFGDGGSATSRLAQARRSRSILDSVQQEAASLQKTLGSSDRTKVNEYLDSVREVERRIQHAEGTDRRAVAAAARSSHGHSRRLRRAHEADVRSSGAGVSGRHHPRHLAAHRARAERPQLSRNRRGRTTPLALASSRRSRLHRQEGQDRRLSHQALFVLPREAGRDPRRRRLAARPLDHHVWRRARESEPARTLESAGAAGRRRRRRN